MSAIVKSLASREEVISDLEGKIRDMEMTTPKSLPEANQRRSELQDEIYPLSDQKPPARSRSVGSKKSHRTKSLPATPDVNFQKNPLDRRCLDKVPVVVDYVEMQQLVNHLENSNDKLLDDNRMLTKNIIEKNECIKHLEQKLQLIKLQFEFFDCLIGQFEFGPLILVNK